MINNQKFLDSLNNSAFAKVDTKKRRILLYDNKILVFKKFDYTVVLEIFIRLQDIDSFSYVKNTNNINSLEIKLAKRSNINKRRLSIPFKYPSSAAAVNDFLCLLSNRLEEMNSCKEQIYFAWQEDDCLYADGDNDYVPNYKFPDRELAEELKTILQGGNSWIGYIEEELPADSLLRTDDAFVNSNGAVETVFEIGVRYYQDGIKYNEDAYYKAAFECFQLAMGSGKEAATFYLGLCYLYGHGTNKNPEYAMRWLCQDAKHNKYAYELINECCKEM